MGNFWESVERSPLIYHISSSNPIFGTLTAMHYFTLFILTGTAVIFDLHLLGWVAKDRSSEAYARAIFPWTWVCLALAAFSGFSLWLTDASDYYRSPVMNIKLVLVLMAFFVTVFIRSSVRSWDQEPMMPGIAKVAAVVSICLWIVCILCGNFIAALCGLG